MPKGSCATLLRVDLWCNTHLAQDRPFPSTCKGHVLPHHHVTSTLPRGEGTFFHIPSYKVKATCSTSHQEFKEIPTRPNHERPAQTSHLGLTKFLHQNGHRLLLLLHNIQHQGPPHGPFTPKCRPEAMPGPVYPKLCSDLRGGGGKDSENR